MAVAAKQAAMVLLGNAGVDVSDYVSTSSPRKRRPIRRGGAA
jgi:hypothetical protein